MHEQQIGYSSSGRIAFGKPEAYGRNGVVRKGNSPSLATTLWNRARTSVTLRTVLCPWLVPCLITELPLLHKTPDQRLVNARLKRKLAANRNGSMT